MPPLKYAVGVALAFVFAALSAWSAPSPQASARRRVLRACASAGLMALAAVAVDAAVRYVQGGWPALLPQGASDRFFLFTLVLGAAAGLGALALAGGRPQLILPLLQSVGLAVCSWLLLGPLSRGAWSGAELALAIAGWSAAGTLATIALHALLRRLAPPVGAAAMALLPVVLAAGQFLWGHDATGAMTTGALAAAGAGFLLAALVRKGRLVEAPALLLWMGLLTLSTASTTHYSWPPLPVLSLVVSLLSPVAGGLAAAALRRRALAWRCAASGLALGACLAAGLLVAALASTASSGP